MAETFDDFFTSLFFGNGNILGMLLIIAFFILLVVSWKYGYLIAIPASLIVAVSYIENNLAYNGALMLVFTAFSLYLASKEIR